MITFLQTQTFAAITIFSTLTVVGQVIVVLLLIALFARRNVKALRPIVAWFSSNGLVLMLVVALAATLGSLFFSDIAGWTPCKSCWYQRIFMYPQVVLLSIALWKKDRNIAPYILVLSIIGALVAIEHYSQQVTAALQPIDPNVPCDATGVSCATTQIHFTFGYITLPMMALTAFALNALGSVIVMKKK